MVAEGRMLSMYRLSREGQPTQLTTTFLSSGGLQPKGAVFVLREGDYWACTVFDGNSKRLYLIHLQQHTLDVEAIHASGEVHYSTILDGHVLILVFEPDESTITLLDRATDQRTFEVLPVTLCEGTTSVYLTSHSGQRLFLFNERIIDQREKTNYRLSLLHPAATGPKYEKLTLVEGDARIEEFSALKAGDSLYVLYLRRDTLNLLSLSLQNLLSSP
jgi:hypothetical protein